MSILTHRVMRLFLVGAMLALAACGGQPATSTTAPVSHRSAALGFAQSAQRALEGTSYEVIGAQGVADLVAGLCAGLGIGAIEATVTGLDVAGTPGDAAILTEVLSVGLAQVCPDRISVDLAGVYLDAVGRAVGARNALDAFDEGDAVRAGPMVCDVLEAGRGVEAALLEAIDALFGVALPEIDAVAGSIDDDQGVVVGAVVAAATALLCPQFVAEVEEYMGSL